MKGARGINKLVDFWKRRISLSAREPEKELFLKNGKRRIPVKIKIVVHEWDSNL